MPATKTRLYSKIQDGDLLYCTLGDHWLPAEKFVQRGPNRAEAGRSKSYRAYCKDCHRSRGGRRRGPATLGTQGRIYLIGERGSRFAVKVGYSVAPVARLRELQTGNPRKLEILATLDGTPVEERKLHLRYNRHRLVGEWFACSPDIMAEFGLDAHRQPLKEAATA